MFIVKDMNFQNTLSLVSDKEIYLDEICKIPPKTDFFSKQNLSQTAAKFPSLDSDIHFIKPSIGRL